MKLITSEDQLAIGKLYWTRRKDNKQIEMATVIMGIHTNYLVMEFGYKPEEKYPTHAAINIFEIIGPISNISQEDFDLIFK